MISETLAPPAARKDPKFTTLHGFTLKDDYAWLRNKTSEEVLAYLTSENAYTEAVMAPTAGLQAKLYAEMLSHIKETDESVPYPDRGWMYWTRTIEGKQYPIHCRRLASQAGAPEQVLLDVNLLAEGQAFMAVGAMSVSPSGNLLAYSTDNTGFRQYTLHLRRLDSGLELREIAGRVGSVVWAADSRTLFYTTEDPTTKRQNQLYRRALLTIDDGSLAFEEPVLVYEEPDERFNIGAGLTRDRRYLLLEAGSHTTNEYRFLAADHPTGEFTLIAPRIDDQEYHPDHRDGLFYLRTNDAAEHFRLVTAPVARPGRESWKPFYESPDRLPLEDFDLFQDFLVISERDKGLPTLTLYDFAEDNSPTRPKPIAFPEPTYTAQAHVNREFGTQVFRYGYTSLVSPASVYEFSPATGASTLLKQQEVPGGFDSSRYASERLWITAPDGVEVPVSLVYRRDRFQKDGTNPLYLYGYGSYGYALPVGFSATRLSLLDRGLVLAYAHIRGGGELGDPWHDAGKMNCKRNTFTDFIAVTQGLVRLGYGSADRVAIEGGSAGGLLMGAVLNIAAQMGQASLFRVVLSHVPFVDVMNTMLDATLPLTVAEYEEWGNPNEPEAFAYMLSYSPYENLEALEGQAIPAMLVKTSLNDSQVMYWEPAKYVAKLRTLKRNETPLLLLHINMDAGHGGASGRYDYLKEIAFDYAFLLTELEAD
jgi:oligopeptidase B